MHGGLGVGPSSDLLHQFEARSSAMQGPCQSQGSRPVGGVESFGSSPVSPASHSYGVLQLSEGGEYP